MSQEVIGLYMGGTSCGVSQQDIANAVNHFTLTFDAYWDLDGDVNFEPFMARQITSIDHRVPVIPIIDFNHAVIVNGGDWHSIAGKYQWDFVYYHDPLVGANLQASSAGWIRANCPVGGACEQIISSVATSGWASNYSAIGSQVVDSSGCGSGGCMAENQELP